jgi:predicted nucleotidyltransferase component of viral defense system
MLSTIKNTRTPFNIDMGVGDVVIPKPQLRLLPTQLDEFQGAEAVTYSLESIIAEKFDAIISRMELSSRMKDYYDIFYLATKYNFEGRKLQEAIFETLQNRRTIYEADSLKKIYSFRSDPDMMKKWKHFIKGTLKQDIEFELVIDTISRFIGPVFEAILKESELFATWHSNKLSYE